MRFQNLTLATLALAVFASAQPLTYSLVEADGAKPAPRIDGTIAYDSTARRLYLFGGSANGGERNDLWSYSFTERRWIELQPAGERPPARLGHTLLFDAARRRLIVFGGQAGGFFSDTWAYDLQRNSWARLAGDNAGPSRRYGHSAIFDTARDRMVVSHGFTNSGRFDDTWAFEFATNTWRELSPASGRPLRRCLHHAVHDAAGDQMLLYGGCASGAGPCPLGDLWSLNLSTNRWTEITGGTRPAAREHYGVAFDVAQNRMVVFGGSGGGLRNDTWVFDTRARAWRELPLTGQPPSARDRHHGVFASDRNVTYFFGGNTASGLSNELWLLGPGFVAARPEVARDGVAGAFDGRAGAVAPGQIVSIFGSGLGPVEGFALGYDPVTGRLPVSGPGLSVSIGGVAAPLYYVSASQLNVQVPYELSGRDEAALTVMVNGSTSDPVTLPIAATRPGLFPRAIHPNGELVTAENPAAPGGIVIFFATGQGVTIPASVTGAQPANGVYPSPTAAVSMQIGGMDAEVLFSGQAPGTVGVMQLNVRIPAAAGAGVAAPVMLRVGGGVSQDGVSIAIR